MSSEAEWRREFATLRAERDVARAEWRSAARGLAEKARDPLGLGAMFRQHPVATTGVGVGIGGFVLNWLVRTVMGKFGKSKAGSSSRESSNGASPQGSGSSIWTVLLRDAALSVAVPWVLRLLKEKLGWDGRTGLDADDRAQSGAPDVPDDHADHADHGRDAAPRRTAGASGNSAPRG